VNDHLYYLFLNDQQAGPYTLGQLGAMWRSGAVTAETQFWIDGNSEWQPLLNISFLLDPSPPQIPQAAASPFPPLPRSTETKRTAEAPPLNTRDQLKALRDIPGNTSVSDAFRQIKEKKLWGGILIIIIIIALGKCAGTH
jgi:hypothetical protein